ncbi:putative uncharacterized protein DDB_G0283223 [Oppia nitens]|uniref:putative uncharacterized protein DDB_G0283223 n=1 Tax=Oppia nitens TaxID=1686743 RepID=UPI0023DB3074|nr:putative uncharacterized protein DDB_G0283223 [Oppia nitens]
MQDSRKLLAAIGLPSVGQFGLQTTTTTTRPATDFTIEAIMGRTAADSDRPSPQLAVTAEDDDDDDDDDDDNGCMAADNNSNPKLHRNRASQQLTRNVLSASIKSEYNNNNNNNNNNTNIGNYPRVDDTSDSPPLSPGCSEYDINHAKADTR